MVVHNHGTNDGAGTTCMEVSTPEGLRGTCILLQEYEEYRLVISNLVNVLAIRGKHSEGDCDVCATVIHYQNKYKWLSQPEYRVKS